MTIDKKSLIILLMKKEIDLSVFLNEFHNIYGDLDIYKELIFARETKDGELVDLLLYLAAVVNFEFECVDVLNNLIIDDWHERHEELARLLEHYKNESSVDYLYQAALLKLDYRDYDEDFVLADKCIRALAKINNENAVEKLKSLCFIDNETIKRSAKKQLSKLGIID